MQIPTEDFEIEYSEDEAALATVAQDFIRSRHSAQAVRAQFTSELGYDPGTWSEMVRMGWPGVAIHAALGGSGLGFESLVPLVEAEGRRLLTTPLTGVVLAANALARSGPIPLQKTWLPRLAAGTVAGIALREPNGDFEVASPSATAVSTGDGFVLDGVKVGVTFADQAAFLIISVLAEGQPRLALIERDQLPAGAVRRMAVVDESQRSFAVDLSGVRIPSDALFDDPNGVTELYRDAVLLMTAEMCGACAGSLDLMVDYMKVRQQFGRPIGSFQGLKHPAADLFTQKEVARSLLYGAKSYWGQERGWRLARMAASKIADLFARTADRGIQFHGAFGFTHDCDAGLFLKRAIWSRAQYGDGAHFRRSLAEELFS
jgi:alkylation response protein AidB-like acyl-CoA dehydrogenase